MVLSGRLGRSSQHSQRWTVVTPLVVEKAYKALVPS